MVILWIILWIVFIAAGVGIVASIADFGKKSKHKPYGPYEAYIKRPLGFCLSLGALIVLSPVMGITAILVKTKLGSPVIFKQPRPGNDEKIFNIYKFRTMTDERDENGDLLPDEERLTDFGKFLRSTSLDELPELFNILKGEMAVIGPRPQLVRDMVFMTDEQRQRHSVRPGLSGLAQINGRNAISWDEKLGNDLIYVKSINFLDDLKIVCETIKKSLIREGISDGINATSFDYGEELLNKGLIDNMQFIFLNKYAEQLVFDFLLLVLFLLHLLQFHLAL